MEIDLRQVIRALLRWGWTIILLAVLGGLAGYGLASLQTPTYSATTSLLVTTPLSSTLIDGGSRAETYRNLVESGPVLDRVILELGLEHDRRELAENITTSVVTNTQLIQITVEDDDAARAADIANSTARNFVNQVSTLTVGQLEQTLSELQSESDALSVRLDDIDSQIAELDEEATEVNALQSERLRVAQTIADLDSSIRTINEQLVTSTTPVAVADAAVVSEEPDSPRPLLIGVLGVFLGGLIGLGLVAVLEFMDTKLRRDDDVEALTGRRLLARVPMDGIAATNRLVAMENPDSAATESIRMLRAHLAGQIARGDRNVLVFTSARGEAPVSQVVGNLGVLMAQSGFRTVVIDANLRELTHQGLFGLRSGNNRASERAEGGSGPGGPSGIENLSIFPVGDGMQNPSEFIGSARFGDLVREARKSADVVLIDTPAMLVHSEALSAAAIADGIVVVAREGQTDRGDLQEAAALAEDDGLTLVGFVVAQG